MTALVSTLAFAGTLVAHPLLVVATFALAAVVVARRWLHTRALLAVLVATTIACCSFSDFTAQLASTASANAPAAPALVYPLIAALPALHVLLSH